MDMTILGEIVVAADRGQMTTGYWMPAGGNDGVAGLEVFLNTVASAFKVHLDTKSSDEDDSAAASIGSVTVSAAGSTPQGYKFDVAEAKDLVRYRVESLDPGIVHLQFSQPLWQPN